MFYLDDMLIIRKSYEEWSKNIHKTRALVQELRFVINEQKSLSILTHRCKFLGLIFDLRKMFIELTEDKVQRTVKFLNQFSTISSCTIREFSVFIGTLVSLCLALKYGMIYVRGFEKERARALEASNDNFDATINLRRKFKEKFIW